MELSLKKIVRTNDMFSMLTKYGIFFVFVMLIIFFSLSNERFFTVENLLLILQQASPLGIGVVGMIFVLLVVGIDISVGRSMFFISTIIGYMISRSGIIPVAFFNDLRGILIVFSIVISMGLAIGFINGYLVTKFKLLPFIVTLATGSILRGFGLKISGSASLDVTVLGELSNGRIGGVPNVLIIFVLVLVAFDFLLRQTTFGRHLMAIGNSPKNAEKAGLKVNRNIILAYIICGVLGAVGGILSAGQIGSVPAAFGEGNEFIIISAAVLGGNSLFGGKGNILPGAVIGILLITTIMNGLAMINASPYIYTIVRGLIIFLSVALDSVKHTGDLR